jgi:two-component system OmpR family sensor kinase
VSLRARLLTVIAILIASYVVAAFVIVSTQRDKLIEQTDRQLSRLPMVGPAPPPDQRTTPSNTITIQSFTTETDAEFTEVYIGVVDDENHVRTLLSGALLDGTPNIADAVTKTGGEAAIVTIGSVGSSTRFRALVTPQPGSTSWVVSALSLEETDAAISRLVQMLCFAGAVTLLVLGTAVFWIERLGLRPIEQVTAAAEAIAAGDRAHRVEMPEERTEAGKLARAFNVMLDERDLSEARLRQFIADASHELRTPLTSIRGYLELYRQGAFHEEEQLNDVVRRLSAESTRMYALVEDLLTLAALDEDRPLRLDTVEIGQILRDAAQDAQAVQPDRAIDVVTPATGLAVTADRGLLIQLVGILVSNALIHTPVEAAISLKATTEAEWAVITVSDTGPGLDSETAARVFDRFWRKESSRTREKTSAQSGSGLGLAIARSIAEAHGGAITLRSSPGNGSTFTVRLPRYQPSSPPNQKSTEFQ